MWLLCACTMFWMKCSINMFECWNHMNRGPRCIKTHGDHQALPWWRSQPEPQSLWICEKTAVPPAIKQSFSFASLHRVGGNRSDSSDTKDFTNPKPHGKEYGPSVGLWVGRRRQLTICKTRGNTYAGFTLWRYICVTSICIWFYRYLDEGTVEGHQYVWNRLSLRPP